MNRVQLVVSEPIPILELSQYLVWPCEEVLWIECRQVMTRRTVAFDFEASENNRPVRVPLKGRHNIGVPVEFVVRTTKGSGSFAIYRHWDWYWEMSWALPFKECETFRPPKLRDEWVRDLLNGVKRRGRYIPHPEEKPLPKRTFQHCLSDPNTPFFCDDMRMDRWQRMTQKQRELYTYWIDNWKGKKPV
jgi:hypothetical protein